MSYDIVSKGRSHLYDLAVGLQGDPEFNKLRTCWPKFKFDKLNKNKIESYFYFYFISYFFSRYIDVEKNILNIIYNKKQSANKAIVDINLAGNLLDKYKQLFLDHPTTSYHYQIKQWQFEEDKIGIKIKRLQKLKALYNNNDIEKIYSKSTKIIVPSIASKNSFEKNIQEKIEYIPFWFPEIKSSIFSSSKKTTIKNISFIGIICPSKGIHYLIDALNKINFKGILHLFGSVLYEEYKHSLIHNKKTFEIKLYGHIPQLELYQQLANMDLAVMPSVSEGLPLSYLQALSLGVPVIGSKDSALEEVIGSEYIYNTKNTDELANLITSFLEGEEYSLDSINKNNKYNLDNYIINWRNILNEPE